MLCEYGCNLEANYILKNGKYCCEERTARCPAIKQKNSEGTKRSYKNGRFSYFRDGENPNRDWAKGKHFWNDIRIKRHIPLDEIFTSNNTKKISSRKAILINERGYKCEKCGISSWQEEPITLEMDHIDGDITNNVKENLKLLCPNCHSQTITWKKGKSMKKKQTSDVDFIEALTSTSTIHQALIKLGMSPKGANYVRAKKLLANLTTS